MEHVDHRLTYAYELTNFEDYTKLLCCTASNLSLLRIANVCVHDVAGLPRIIALCILELAGIWKLLFMTCAHKFPWKFTGFEYFLSRNSYTQRER